MSLEPYNKEGMKRKKGHDLIHDCDLMPSYTKKKGKIKKKERIEEFIPSQCC